MARRKKTFPCGHEGLGSFCHRCAEAEKQAAATEQARRDKRDDEAARLRADRAHHGLDLSALPPQIRTKARRTLDLLAAGTPYMALGGKRLQGNRRVVSIPIGFDYRLLCRDEEGRIVPKKVLSHETYNHDPSSQV